MSRIIEIFRVFSHILKRYPNLKHLEIVSYAKYCVEYEKYKFDIAKRTQNIRNAHFLDQCSKQS